MKPAMQVVDCVRRAPHVMRGGVMNGRNHAVRGVAFRGRYLLNPGFLAGMGLGAGLRRWRGRVFGYTDTYGQIKNFKN